MNAIEPEFGPVLQLKDIRVQYWANDDVYVIEEIDGTRIDLSSDDLRELKRWLNEREI